MCLWHREGTQTASGGELAPEEEVGAELRGSCHLDDQGFVGHSGRSQWHSSLVVPVCPVLRGLGQCLLPWSWTGREAGGGAAGM